jgi:hypothetical protein
MSTIILANYVQSGHLSLPFAYKIDGHGSGASRYTKLAVATITEEGRVADVASVVYGPYVYGGANVAGIVHNNVLFATMFTDQSGVTTKGGVYAFTYDGTDTLVEDAHWQIATPLSLYYSLCVTPDGHIVVLVEDDDGLVSGLYVLTYSPGLLADTGFSDVNGYTGFGSNALVLMHNADVIVFPDKSTDTMRAYAVTGAGFAYKAVSGAFQTANGRPYDIQSDGTYLWVNTAQVFSYAGGASFTQVASAVVSPAQRNPMAIGNGRMNLLSGGTIKSYTINGSALQLDATTTGNLSTFGYGWATYRDYMFMVLPSPFAPDYAGGTTYTDYQYATYNGTIYKSLQNGNVGHTPPSSPTYWEVGSESGAYEFAGSQYNKKGPAPLPVFAQQTDAAVCSGMNLITALTT